MVVDVVERLSDFVLDDVTVQHWSSPTVIGGRLKAF
jgi:hypothetical protein